MDEEDRIYREKTIARYKGYYEKYGNDIRSLGWKSEEKIKKRFQTLYDIGIRTDVSVLDVGCGFGDFPNHFAVMFINGYLGFNYTGIDIVPEFIEVAKKLSNFGDDEVKFKLGTIDDIKEKYDWVVGSGIFNHKSCSMKYIKKTLKKAFELCNKGIAFNFMSTYVDYRNPELFYTNPSLIFDYAKTLSKYVVLRHDYMPYEFTIYIYKR